MHTRWDDAQATDSVSLLGTSCKLHINRLHKPIAVSAPSQATTGIQLLVINRPKASHQIIDGQGRFCLGGTRFVINNGLVLTVCQGSQGKSKGEREDLGII